MLRLPILLTTLLLVAACGGEAPKLNAGMRAPAFTAVRVDGAAARFPDDFRGRPVVIRFWADWCPYCEGEMRYIDQYYRHRQGRGPEVLAVNAGQPPQTVAAFVKRLGVAYPALLDEQSAVARQYGVVGLPTTYFVGADGIVKAKLVGESDQANFEKLADALGGARP